MKAQTPKARFILHREGLANRRLAPEDRREHREKPRREVEGTAYGKILDPDKDVPAGCGEISPYLALYREFLQFFPTEFDDISLSMSTEELERCRGRFQVSPYLAKE